MTFAAAGSFFQATTLTPSLPTSTDGDLFMLGVVTASATVTVSGVSGGGCSNWTQMGSSYDGTEEGAQISIWAGEVTSAGSNTLTITLSGAFSGNIRVAGQEFSTTAGAWSYDTSAGVSAASGTAFPSVTPAGAGELYFSWSYVDDLTTGSTSGYTYDEDAHGNWCVYNPDCTSAAQAPTFPSASDFDAFAVLVKEGTPTHTGPAFRPFTQAVRARFPRRPVLRGRVGSSPGVASTSLIRTTGNLRLSPFGFSGLSLSQYGLMDSTRALLVLNAILLQEPVASAGGISVRLGSSSPAAGTLMTELLNGNGYTAGGQACSFSAASSAQITNSSVLSWTNTSGGWLIEGVELWDQTPVRWMFADWTGEPIAVAPGNTFVLPASGLDIFMY